MLGAGIALLLIGVLMLFLFPWAGIPLGIAGVVLLVLAVAGVGRRAAQSDETAP